LHQRRRPGYPTEGCVAFARADLIWLAQRVTPGARLIVRR
jgi:L,D-peptidoglycan transpeptidase YkuD (ErfK/YbiS/YcfS/YnhG family)